MKRMILLLILVCFLSGCGDKPAEVTTAPTEPPIPWIQELGEPWDAEGALVELPLQIPNGLIYTSHMIFDGDLLLWGQDNHRKDHPTTEICILDLDTGKVLAQADLKVGCTMMPQALGEALYLVDSNSGTIVKLDKYLNQIGKWQADIQESSVYMGANGIAYVNQWEESAYVLNLETGEKGPILEPDTAVASIESAEGYLKVVYYHPDSGEECTAFIDLETGERFDAPGRGGSSWSFRDGTFLLNDFDESFVFTLFPHGGEAVTADMGYDYIELADQNRLFKTVDNGNQIALYDFSGKALAQCTVFEEGYPVENVRIIPNQTFGGYFLLLSSHGGGLRLLYWDTEKGGAGSDIPFAPVPKPSEQEALIQERVGYLETEYGLDILVGEDAAGYFYDFEAEVVTDPEDILDALDTLENALDDYPEDFFKQLRYGNVHRTQIHIMGAITATNSEYVDTYEGFVQDGYESHVMVVDIYLSDETTYYHEFSHIIDSFLEWDAENREDALFSEEIWNSMNPDWFPGYTWDYSWQQSVEDYSAFVDDYSTIKPTEDRARVMEYAMAEYGYWTFHDCEVLTDKLDYYSRCIRDAFDTTGWPETLLWEQYLTE